ncbi:unnamed protein product [Fraxinus pennsylvanica]|uniref:Cellulose synthase-like protein G3 n=1 Tax=Fraxinus pennsylvanica TaxID=56036 RepID=A0AAD2E5Q7_9LAMI|nr:unnamed protein product [Fraxinus pennsylvanica]
MASATTNPTLHSVRRLRRRFLNRIFAGVYTTVILALLYHHAITLLHSTTFTSFCISFTIFISDILLAYMWLTSQSFRMNPVAREEFPENLVKFFDRKDFPAMDIFICTADPYKEPPINVVNTALSVMAYDFPTEKLSVYVSDDGGSELTLFAFMEAAEFSRTWLPFCKENNIIERCPDTYFRSNYTQSPKTVEMKMMYDNMKTKIENVVEKGRVSDEYISDEKQRRVLSQYWTKDFTRQNHPSVIQVLLDTNKDKDNRGYSMPNLVYVSREKRQGYHASFQGWRPQCPDCDMYSNDPLTPQRVLCYISDKSNTPNLGYIQFPQRYHGLNNADIYGSELKRLVQINSTGMDGLDGPIFMGTGCFFLRRAFFGGPSSPVQPETQELGPNYIVNKPIVDREILYQAHRVCGCNYENPTSWGSKIGFRYGSLVEDYYTRYQLQCEGWKSIFCDPIVPAFLGDVPISLRDFLNQNRRWAFGLLEVAFSKYSPITFGIQAVGILMGLAYAHYAFWPISGVPITIYAFLPSLTLLNGISIFPNVNDPWFLAYIFLFLGAYGQDCLDFILAKGTFRRWWSDQRMWHMRGVSSHLFGSIEYIMKHLGFGVLNCLPIYEAMVFRSDEGRMPTRTTIISTLLVWGLCAIATLVLKM